MAWSRIAFCMCFTDDLSKFNEMSGYHTVCESIRCICFRRWWIVSLIFFSHSLVFARSSPNGKCVTDLFNESIESSTAHAEFIRSAPTRLCLQHSFDSLIYLNGQQNESKRHTCQTAVSMRRGMIFCFTFVEHIVHDNVEKAFWWDFYSDFVLAKMCLRHELRLRSLFLSFQCTPCTHALTFSSLLFSSLLFLSASKLSSFNARFFLRFEFIQQIFFSGVFARISSESNFGDNTGKLLLYLQWIRKL